MRPIRVVNGDVATQGYARKIIAAHLTTNPQFCGAFTKRVGDVWLLFRFAAEHVTALVIGEGGEEVELGFTPVTHKGWVAPVNSGALYGTTAPCFCVLRGASVRASPLRALGEFVSSLAAAVVKGVYSADTQTMDVARDGVFLPLGRVDYALRASGTSKYMLYRPLLLGKAQVADVCAQVGVSYPEIPYTKTAEWVADGPRKVVAAPASSYQTPDVSDWQLRDVDIDAVQMWDTARCDRKGRSVSNGVTYVYASGKYGLISLRAKQTGVVDATLRTDAQYVWPARKGAGLVLNSRSNYPAYVTQHAMVGEPGICGNQERIPAVLSANSVGFDSTPYMACSITKRKILEILPRVTRSDARQWNGYGEFNDEIDNFHISASLPAYLGGGEFAYPDVMLVTTRVRLRSPELQLFTVITGTAMTSTNLYTTVLNPNTLEMNEVLWGTATRNVQLERMRAVQKGQTTFSCAVDFRVAGAIIATAHYDSTAPSEASHFEFFQCARTFATACVLYSGTTARIWVVYEGVVYALTDDVKTLRLAPPPARAEVDIDDVLTGITHVQMTEPTPPADGYFRGEVVYEAYTGEYAPHGAGSDGAVEQDHAGFADWPERQTTVVHGMPAVSFVTPSPHAMSYRYAAEGEEYLVFAVALPTCAYGSEDVVMDAVSPYEPRYRFAVADQAADYVRSVVINLTTKQVTPLKDFFGVSDHVWPWVREGNVGIAVGDRVFGVFDISGRIT